MKPKMIFAIAFIFILALLLVYVLPPSSGKLPHPRSPVGIAERTRLEVDGAPLSLMLLSDDVRNPVLLVCGGGPGIPQYLLEAMYPSPLPHEFTVCYWDYRGTGASFDPHIAPGDMTTERYVRDALAVTEYLSARFSQEKIYLMGHSFGTYIALKTVQAQPQKYKCYIAQSQICDQRESEYRAFDYMMRQYEDAGNKRMAAKFKQYNIRTSEDDYNGYFFSGLRDTAMHDLGVGTTRKMRSVITGIFFPSLRCTAYTPRERINLWRGKSASARFPVTKDAIAFNAFRAVPSVELPVCFIVGQYDCTCDASLQQEYYERIAAPQKRIFVFENSAHSPVYEEHEKARTVLSEIKADMGD